MCGTFSSAMCRYAEIAPFALSTLIGSSIVLYLPPPKLSLITASFLPGYSLNVLLIASRITWSPVMKAVSLGDAVEVSSPTLRVLLSVREVSDEESGATPAPSALVYALL